MKLTEEDKKYILDEHLRHISCIASKEYQKRVWILAKGPEEDSFDDSVCDFFLTCDSILENYKDFKITDNQQKILMQFRNDFESFVDGDRPYLPEDFIDTPEWEKIMQMAKDVLVAFDYEKISKQS